MPSEKHPPIPRPGSRRRWPIALLCLLAALAVAVPAAFAVHDFTDVPDAHPFHADIGAVADAGITGGKTCDPPGTPPTFCPTDTITRQAAAAFMHRGLSRVAQGGPVFGDNSVPQDTLTPVGEVTIDVGGTGGTQFVRVEGQVTIRSTETDCPCTALALIRETGDESGPSSLGQLPVAGAENVVSLSAVNVFPAAPGSHTYELAVVVGANATALISQLTATTHAFGTIEAPPPEAQRSPKAGP